VGISLFLITRYGKCVIFRVLISSVGADTEDLVLNEVIIVEGFYVNIILEALIVKAGA